MQNAKVKMKNQELMVPAIWTCLGGRFAFANSTE